MSAPEFIYLASQSPRRRELLTQIGVAHELLLPTPDEDAESLEVVLEGDTPSAYVKRVTALKLIAARAIFTGARARLVSQTNPCRSITSRHTASLRSKLHDAFAGLVLGSW